MNTLYERLLILVSHLLGSFLDDIIYSFYLRLTPLLVFLKKLLLIRFGVFLVVNLVLKRHLLGCFEILHY